MNNRLTLLGYAHVQERSANQTIMLALMIGKEKVEKMYHSGLIVIVDYIIQID